MVPQMAAVTSQTNGATDGSCDITD
jgi:hypothetical protein